MKKILLLIIIIFATNYSNNDNFKSSWLLKSVTYIEEGLGIISEEEERIRNKRKDDQIALKETIANNNKMLNQLNLHQKHYNEAENFDAFVDGALGVEGQRWNRFADRKLGLGTMVSNYRAKEVMQKDKNSKAKGGQGEDLSRDEQVYLESIGESNDINSITLYQDNSAVKLGETAMVSAELLALILFIWLIRKLSSFKTKKEVAENKIVQKEVKEEELSQEKKKTTQKDSLGDTNEIFEANDLFGNANGVFESDDNIKNKIDRNEKNK